MLQIDHYIDRVTEVFAGGETRAKEYIASQVDRIAHRLDRIGLAVDALDSTDEIRKVQRTDIANAAGDCTLEFDGPRAGHSWIIKRVTTVVNDGVASTAVLYVGSISPLNAEQVITDADFFAQDIGEILVPNGSRVFILFDGTPANARLSGSLQVVETYNHPND